MLKFLNKFRQKVISENSLGKYLLYAFGEIILVVIGILLALQVNNWNENRKRDSSITTTLRLLKDEIRTNKNNIERVKGYHIMVIDTLEAMEIPKSEEEVTDALRFWRGMQTPRMQNAAFQTSIQSGVSKEFDPMLLKTLNNLYTYQDSYNTYTASTGQIFFNSDFSDFKNFKRNMTTIGIAMRDLYYYDAELLMLFENTLAKMDSVYPPQ